MRNKYNARKCSFDGEVYDSKKEMHRHQELLLMEKAGQISNLRRQVEYPLLPTQRETVIRKGVPKPGKVIEKGVVYTADFVYEENGETIVEDSKGVKARDYILRRKMMLYFHGIRIREV